MAKNVEYSPFLFPSTILSYPSESTPSSSSTPLPPSFCSSRSNSSFNSPYKSSSSLPRPPLSHSASSHFPPAAFGPCAACKFHNHRCSDRCYIASFLPPGEAHNFAVVDSVFGSGNIVDFVQHNSNGSYIPLLFLLRDTRREDEVDSGPKNDSGINIQNQTCESVSFDPVGELIQARELTKQLNADLRSGSPDTTVDHLVQRILSSFERTLLMLNSSGGLISQQQNDVAPSFDAKSNPLKAPLYIDASPGSVNFNAAKKRKTSPSWTNVVVASENGFAEALDDGYSWTKYGQKEILGAKYPRSYYRCIYRPTRNCWATKQVQRSNEDPTIFEVSYRQVHTCSHGPALPLPEKQEEQNNTSSNSQLQLTLSSFQPSANSQFLDPDLALQPLQLNLALK